MKKLIPIYLLLLVLLPISLHAQLPAGGLVAWYPFCGNTNDYSGNGYNLHDSGAVLTTDRFGNANCAYYFNGVNNIMFRTPPLPTDATNFTYAAWILFDVVNNTVIVANGNLNSDGYEMLVTGPTLLSLGSDVGVIFGNVNQFYPTPVALHQWHQVVLRRRATSTFDFIIDTVLIGTITSTFHPTLSTEEFAVGMDFTNGTNPFKGNIDDIAVYNRALSDTEIRQLYHYNPSNILLTPNNDTTVCAGVAITLSDTSPGGTWTSTNTSVATVSSSGFVTTLSAGTSIISYTTGTGCVGMTTVTASPLPDITGINNVCTGLTITLSDTVAGGTWTSSNSSIATVNPVTGVVTGAGSGIVNIIRSIPSGCFAIVSITVNSAPSTISGGATVCTGSTITLSDAVTGGTWSSNNSSVATINPSPGIVSGVISGTAVITYSTTAGCFATTSVTVNQTPPGISGFNNVCTGSTITLSDATTGGTWTSSNSSIATVDPGTGVASGANAGVVNITYTVGSGCFVTASVTVNQAPTNIAGATNVCTGSTITLSDAVTGGTWSSNNSTVATVNSGSGIVSGSAPGSATITYSTIGGCFITTSVTVNQTPPAIAGANNVCTGSTIALSDGTTGGTWTSSNSSLATIDPGTGIVTGSGSGIVNISYTVASGCFVTYSVTVNQTPSIINGPAKICTGSTITLSDALSGGTWSSNNSAVATVLPGSGIVSGVIVGSATITYSTTAGCYTTASVTVNQTPPGIPGPNSVCTGSSITLSDATTGGTWTSGNSSLATVNPGTGVVTGAGAGVVNITYTVGSCFVSTSVTVNQTPLAIIGPASICTGSIVILSDVVAGGTWSSNNSAVSVLSPGSGTISGVAVGSATITYSTTAGCFITTTITVNQTPPAIAGANNVCTTSVITLSDATTGGTWTSGNSSLATITPGTGIVTGTGAGTVNITYTVASGCFVRTSVTVNQTPSLIPGPTNVCTGSTTSLSDALAGGTWSSNNSTVATVSPGSGIVSGVLAGTAIITYSTTAGCFVTTSVTVNQTPPAITGILNVCTGSTTNLSDTTTGGTWTSGSITIATINPGTGVVTGASAGTANITYTSGLGCIVTTSVTVNQTPSAIIGALMVCTGSTITLSDGLAGGTWSSSNSAIATISPGPGIVSGVMAGTTIITYSTVAGCFITTSVTVNQTPPAITGPNIACAGLTIILSDTVSGGTWSSSNPSIATIDAISGLVSGIGIGLDTISYSNAGCITTTTITVNIVPSVTAGTPNICTDGTTILNSTPGGGTWSLSNTNVATITPTGLGSAVISGIDAGTTIVTYSLSGCFRTNTISAVSILPPITGDVNVCVTQSIVLSDAIIGGTWSSAVSSVMVGSGTGSVTGITAGNAAITYSIGGSCTTITTVTVNPIPDPGTITGISDLCTGTIIALSDNISGGTWSSSNSAASITAGVITGIHPGTDTIKYIVSNAFCSDTATKIITVYTPVSVGPITGPAVLCIGAVINLSDTTTGGAWTSVFPAIATVSPNGLVAGITAGTDTIKYVVSNPGCSDTASHIITVYDHPAIGTISGDNVVCTGSIFILSDATNGGVWSSNNTTVATINNNNGHGLTFNQGTATISYTTGPNAGGCYSTATFTVTTHAIFSTDSSVTQIKCYGSNSGSIAITTNGAMPAFLWSNVSTASSITDLAPGLYTVNITDAATECSAKDTFYISEPDSLQLSAQATNDVCNRGIGSISTSVSGGVPAYQYLWSDNTTSSNVENLHAGTYTVTITDANNCIKDLSVVINADTCSDIVIHNAITPNGDGINDVWVIDGIENYPANTVQVFDKWGDMVFEKTNYSNDWGGKGKSGLLPDGTYYYLVKLNSQNGSGTQNTWTGYLMIKR